MTSRTSMEHASERGRLISAVIRFWDSEWCLQNYCDFLTVAGQALKRNLVALIEAISPMFKARAGFVPPAKYVYSLQLVKVQ